MFRRGHDSEETEQPGVELDPLLWDKLKGA
jgi:hypothetical protein